MTNLFFRNPRLAALTVLMILVAGAAAYSLLPRIEDPILTERFALVTTRLPGASAERVESLVTEPLEEELDEIEEIRVLQSTSRAGVSVITIELFDWVFEVDEVWSRARDRIGDAAPQLPAGTQPSQFEELSTRAYAMIAALVWERSDEPNFGILNRLAKELDDVLRAVPGTEEIDFFGAPDEEMLVEIDPQALVRLGLTAQDVAQQVRASDAKVSAGMLRGDERELILEVDTELESLEQIRDTPIRFGARGHFARLDDIATVRRGTAEPMQELAVIDGHGAVAVSVLVEPARRIDHWSAAADQALTTFEAGLPRGVKLRRVFQQSEYVGSRLRTLMANLALGAVAVTAVVFILMGWRSAVVVSSALPLSALMVLAGMRIYGAPLHQMSITGLIIALGLLIDNAIVIVDEVQSEIREGIAAQTAISNSVGRLFIPLLGSTITTALAFAPLVLMPGPGGEFVGTIGVSVIIAIFSSFFLAMTVTAAFAGRIHGGRYDGPRRGWWADGASNPALARVYRRLLDYVLTVPWRGVALGALLPVFGFIVSRQLPEQFFPPADRDQINVEIELPAHTSIEGTRRVADAARQAMLALDEVEEVQWFLGGSAPTFYYNLVKRRSNTPQYGQALVELTSPDHAERVIRQLQTKLDRMFPGAIVLVRLLEQGPPFDAPVELRLYGQDMDRLRELSREARGILATLPGVIHVRSDMAETLPKLSLAVDEEMARLAGLNHEVIARQLDDTLEGSVGGSVVEATEELPLRVRLAGSRRSRLAAIASLDLLPQGLVRDPRVGTVPISALARFELVPEQATIARRNGVRSMLIQAYLTPGVLPSTVVESFEAQAAAAGLDLPPGYRLEYGGEADARNRAVGNLMSSVSVLLTIMAATLVLSFGSFRVASIVAMVAVMSIGLGVGALWVFGYPFGFMAIVGTMGLVGVAINDSIVVLAVIQEDEGARRGEPQAMVRVVMGATRHVVATTITTIAGFTPLLIAGGSFWRPLATSIAGGVGGATLLALVFVPGIYRILMSRRLSQPAADGADAGSLPNMAEGLAVLGR